MSTPRRPPGDLREAHFALILDHTSESNVLYAVEGTSRFRLVAANRAFISWVRAQGHEIEERDLVGRFFDEVLRDPFGQSESAIEERLAQIEEVVTLCRPRTDALAVPSAHGTYHTERTIAPIADASGVVRHVLLSGRDVTSYKRSELALRASLREKEILLSEVHHRVKNNLQVISSLLALQRASEVEPRVRAALDDSRRRILSMAMVHERLYSSKRFSRVDLAEQVSELARTIAMSAGSPAVSLSVRCSASTHVAIDTAIPLGLVLNELVSNAYRHAFVDGRSGTVDISCEREGDSVVLVVKDDGVGLRQGPDDAPPRSLGLRLVRGLIDQLGGALELTSDRGTTARVRVSLAPAADDEGGAQPQSAPRGVL